MSFTEFLELFDHGYEVLKVKHQTLYVWEKYFLDIAEKKFCLSHDQIQPLTRSIRLAFKDRVEGSAPRDRFEACMLCILDIARADETSRLWPEKAVTPFLQEIVDSHFDAYLLYKAIK